MRSDGKKVDEKTGSRSKLVCYSCGSKGHRKSSSSCTAKEKECPGCKKKGHSKAFCWKIEKGCKISEVVEPEGAGKKVEVDGSLGLLSPGVDSSHFFSCEPWVQEGPTGTLHPKASLKPNPEEVVVGSSPPL